MQTKHGTRHARVKVLVSDRSLAGLFRKRALAGHSDLRPRDIASGLLGRNKQPLVGFGDPQLNGLVGLFHLGLSLGPLVSIKIEPLSLSHDGLPGLMQANGLPQGFQLCLVGS
jgi:hypothetical protein